MNQKKNKANQQGNVSIIVLILLVAGGFFWIINKPVVLTDTSKDFSQSCRPENHPPIDLTVQGQVLKYKKVKTNALVGKSYIDNVEHLVADGQQNIDNKTYDIYVVNREDTQFQSANGIATFKISGFVYATQKVVYSVRFDGGTHEYYLVDIYAPADRDLSAAYTCSETMLDTKVTPTIIIPTPKNKSTIDNLHMQYFTFEKPSVATWYTLHCKPVVYLYPEKEQQVHIGLNPKGYIIDSIPKYPKGGWYVTAYPSGKISYQGKQYDYLYFESKIWDSVTEVPKEGFVLKYEELSSFYQKYLPQLGLNSTEIHDFVEYWEKALPKSPYYFIGFMSEESIDYIDPLTVAPKPDTVIRVRFYFKALEKPITVPLPTLKAAEERNGFTVVEWGGMVKLHQNEPFTCSQ